MLADAAARAASACSPARGRWPRFAAHTALVHADPAHARPGRADRRHEPAHRLRLPVRRPGRVAHGALPHRRRRAARRPVGRGLQPRRGAGLARHAGLPADRPGARASPAPSATSSPTSTASPRCDCLLRDLGVDAATSRATRCRAARHAGRPERRRAPRRTTPCYARARRGAFGADTRVRHLIGLDPARHGVAVADTRASPACSWPSASATWQAARRDLVRICAEIRDELEPETLAAGHARLAAGADAGAPADAARAASPARSTSAAPAAAGRTSARRRPSCRSCGTRWATCRWSASSPPARSRATTCTATPAC